MLYEIDAAWCRAQITKSSTDWQYFRQQRNRCLTVIRNAKSSFYVTALSGYYQGSTTISVGKSICDAFNEHFISSGHLFEKAGFPRTVSDHSAPCWANKLGTQTFSLKPFTNFEVLNAFCSTDPKKSTGADQLEPRLLLLAAPLLVECLT